MTGSTAPAFIALNVEHLRARLQTLVCSPENRAASLSHLAEAQANVRDAGVDPITSTLGLTETEARLVWFGVAFRIDPEVQRLAHLATPDDGLGLTADRLRHLCHFNRWAGSAITDLSPDSRLMKLGVLERIDVGHVHESLQSWIVPLRILGRLGGDRSIDPELARVAREPKFAPAIEKLALGEQAIAEAREAMKSQRAVVIVTGAPGLGRRSLLVAAAAEAGLELLEIDAKRLAKDHATLTKQLRMIARECKLLAKLPLIRNIDALVDEKDQARVELVGTELAAELDTTVFVTSGIQRPQLRWERPVISIELKPPSSLQRATLWRELLTAASEGDADYLATQYPLAPALMHAAAGAALARAAAKTVTPKDIEAGIRAVLDDKLGNFAKRVEVTQGWDDLVIEAEQGQSIMELIARIRQRRTVYEQWGFAAKVGKGLGVSALFSGPPGTGKTMVAALIAKELGLELYQVDMGKLISKYIGETEKQLGELFDAAEAGHAILLFDEADSLFGKRTDVKSSNDRYANLETNYLLQRLESFTGICLLTSNHESNIDPAFQRRLSLHLRFQVPDEQERARLWRAMLPTAAPVTPNIDFRSLARRYEMTGGYIRNAALRAAFLAADAGTPISDAELEHAAQLEYEGMGKIVSPNPAKASSWPARLSSSL
jgi:hypothetical protein